MSGKILKLFFCFRQREKIGRIFSALLDKEFDKDVTFYDVVLHGEVVQFVLN
jgi:hypothetical protein